MYVHLTMFLLLLFFFFFKDLVLIFGIIDGSGCPEDRQQKDRWLVDLSENGVCDWHLNSVFYQLVHSLYIEVIII